MRGGRTRSSALDRVDALIDAGLGTVGAKDTAVAAEWAQ